jgi:ribosomal protein S21
MANVARVRVELKNHNSHASYDERDKDFRIMFSKFKKQCSDAGIMHAYKQHEHFESKSRKIRRKKREAELQMFKAKLKENFTERGKRPHE